MADQLILNGTVICPGIGIGRVVLIDTETVVPKRTIDAVEIAGEQERYTAAAETARQHVREHVRATHHDTPEHGAAVIEAHNAILKDDGFHDGVRRLIAADHKNAEWALEMEGEQVMSQFGAMRDPFFQARAEDVRDMVTGILDVLTQGGEIRAPEIGADEEQVLVTPHLHPSAAMYAQRVGAAAFATESRVVSSHAAILLKGFSIPSVGRVEGLVDAATQGDDIIVDAVSGRVVLRPTKETRERYYRRQKRLHAKATAVPPVACRTADATEVSLLGNMGNPDQVRLILQKGLQGVGLFRTEFFAMENGIIPGENEQSEIYREVIRALDGRPLVVRTFDIGADKEIRSLSVCTGQNPALGVRGIRRHLRGGDAELRAQLRAIIRAAGSAKVGIMVPMVTTVRDVQEAKRHLNRVRDDLDAEGVVVAQGTNITFGAMIETPAAALRIADILNEVDFVSLGTNDLLQYLMAADRDNEDVIDYNDPEAPAFRQLLEFIITEAKRLGRQEDVSICGEVASRRHQIPVLLRMGYRSFSISPAMAEEIRDAIGSTDLAKC